MHIAWQGIYRISVTDLIVESSRSYWKLKKLLTVEAGYAIDENGWVGAWGPTSFQLNCKSMEFSNYPYDKHKCDFLIRSDIYTQVHELKGSEKHLTLRKIYFEQEFLWLHSEVVFGMASSAALPYKIYYSKLPENHTLTLKSGEKYSLAGFYIHLDRHIIPFWINIYIPVSLLVISSWLRYLSKTAYANSHVKSNSSFFLQLHHSSRLDARTNGLIDHNSPHVNQHIWKSAWGHTIIRRILND